MPKEVIDLRDLLNRVETKMIKQDFPFIIFTNGDLSFNVFQNSGLNVLLGAEGNGKTKFLTRAMLEVLNGAGDSWSSCDYDILYVDTERPESQYAATIAHMHLSCEQHIFFDRLQFLAVLDLPPNEIIEAIRTAVGQNEKKKILVIDHMLSLVSDMNNIPDANKVDFFFKELINQGHIIVASIHTAQNGFKGLGHIGSSLQRQASYILEIKNNDENTGFDVTCSKSRISSIPNECLKIYRDDDGFIDLSNLEITQKSRRNDDKEAEEKKKAELIIKKFISKGYATKKQLLDLTCEVMGLSVESSKKYEVFKNHLTKWVVFDKDVISFTEEGKKILNQNL